MKFLNPLKLNTGPLIGAYIIVLFAILGIAGYIITPDSSKDCNDIISSIGNQKPGFACSYVRKMSSSQTENVFKDYFLGKTNQGAAIPIIEGSLSFKGSDSIRFIPYGETNAITISKSKLVKKSNTEYLFYRKFWFGTDRFGRDMLSRIIIGARISLTVGFVSVIISLFLGTIIGMFAGYKGGLTDTFLSWLISVFWSIPTMLIALGLSFVFGKGFWQVLLATGLSTWVEVARVVRGQTMQLREKEFILAVRILGFSTPRILFRHILPNLKGTLTVLATTNFAAAILLEAGLSFLGLGISPPTPSWGLMVNENLGNLVLDNAFLALIPGFSIMLLVMAFNLLSMGLRDILDTRLVASSV